MTAFVSFQKIFKSKAIIIFISGCDFIRLSVTDQKKYFFITSDTIFFAL